MTLAVLSVDLFPATIPIDTHGFAALRKVVHGRLSTDGTRTDSRQTVHCDAPAVSSGFNDDYAAASMLPA